ncbi:hypothetical protein Ddc_13118 [Ditylenchus destructor]|nr:hypothetical protein Ddc_13118 [Ditylenchus destructor]
MPSWPSSLVGSEGRSRDQRAAVPLARDQQLKTTPQRVSWHEPLYSLRDNVGSFLYQSTYLKRSLDKTNTPPNLYFVLNILVPNIGRAFPCTICQTKLCPPSHLAFMDAGGGWHNYRLSVWAQAASKFRLKQFLAYSSLND